jgi:adenylyltransferase/sulfurtransferase
MCCVQRRFASLDEPGHNATRLCGRNAIQIHERARPIDLIALANELRGVGEVRANEYAVRVVLDAHELTVFQDGRAIIKGTEDAAVARTLYARYVGS